MMTSSDLDSIRKQRPDIAKKIELALDWLFSRPWSGKIDFIMLYGSVAMGLSRNNSDIDLVIGITEDRESLIRINKEMILTRPYDELDIRIFDHVPVYIQKKALSGKILYCKDMSRLYDLAYDVIGTYESFKPYLDDYTGVVPLP